MTDPTIQAQINTLIERGKTLTAAQATDALVTTLRMLAGDPADLDEAQRLTRGWIVEALENRFPNAAAAVASAFDAYDARLAAGGDVDTIPEPDYITVLLAHIPGGQA